MAAGVGMVHQHFMLVPGLTGAQNITLGAARLPWLLRPRRIHEQVQRQAKVLGFDQLQLDVPVESLSVGEQQRVEILRVLSRGARVMILDEPTAVLSPEEAEALFSSLEQLCAGGCAVVLISHKLEELRRVASRLTIMRKGEVTARHGDPAGLSARRLASDMVGHAGEISLELPRPEVKTGPVILHLQGVEVADPRRSGAVKGVDLELRAGEIVGLAGVAGNGQLPLLEALAGLRPLSGGSLMLGSPGREIGRLPTSERAELGLRYVPEDRTHTGTAPGLTVRETLLLRRYRHPPCRRGAWLDLGRDDDHCRAQVEQLKVARTGLGQRAGLLSGGNIQKLVLARDLSGEPSVILAMQPTRGLDAWATMEVRRLLLAARTRGAALLLCSEDLEEVLALSDRVAVMNTGSIAGLFNHGDADLNEIGRLMTGGVAA